MHFFGERSDVVSPLSMRFFDVGHCVWFQRGLTLSIEASCARSKMRLPCSPCPFPCSKIIFPCSLIYRKTACKTLLLWYDSEPIQPKTANINPKPTLFPLNSLLTAKIRGDWLARDGLHHQTITFAFLQILERKTASS